MTNKIKNKSIKVHRRLGGSRYYKLKHTPHNPQSKSNIADWMRTSYNKNRKSIKSRKPSPLSSLLPTSYSSPSPFPSPSHSHSHSYKKPAGLLGLAALVALGSIIPGSDALPQRDWTPSEKALVCVRQGGTWAKNTCSNRIENPSNAIIRTGLKCVTSGNNDWYPRAAGGFCKY